MSEEELTRRLDRMDAALARIENAITGDLAGYCPGLNQRVTALEAVEAVRQRRWWLVFTIAVSGAVSGIGAALKALFTSQ